MEAGIRRLLRGKGNLHLPGCGCRRASALPQGRGEPSADAAYEVSVVALPSGFKDVTELYRTSPGLSSSALKRPFPRPGLSPISTAAHGTEPESAGPDLHAGAQEPAGSGGDSFDFAPFIARRFSINNLHEKPAVVFSLAGQEISTPGNLTLVFSQAKAGKSAVIGAIIGAVMSNGGAHDFLGWGAPLNLEKAALIHVDTEQSPYDHEQIVAKGAEARRP